jgi:hypothetical protein
MRYEIPIVFLIITFTFQLSVPFVLYTVSSLKKTDMSSSYHPCHMPWNGNLLLTGSHFCISFLVGRGEGEWPFNKYITKHVLEEYCLLECDAM